MKKLTIPIVMGLLCLSFWARGQENAPLRMGDKVPEEFWTMEHKFFNGKIVDSKNLSEFKGKTLILGFWATWCTTCINNFKNLEVINKKYPLEISILLVNSPSTSRDDLKRLQAFYERRTKNKQAVLNTIFLDEKLKKYFPHGSLPAYIWINKKGYVNAITGSALATIQNFELEANRNIINGKP